MLTLEVRQSASKSLVQIAEILPPEQVHEHVLRIVLHLAHDEMDESFLKRSVNQGFSGGEKKRHEVLQMAVLEPTLSILDETDSGLDIDALRIVANGVNKLHSPDKKICNLSGKVIEHDRHDQNGNHRCRSCDLSFGFDFQSHRTPWKSSRRGNWFVHV